VIYRLLPLNVVIAATSTSILAYNMPTIEIPVKATIMLWRLNGVLCSGAGFRFECRYRVSAEVIGLDVPLFGQEMSDTFEMTGEGWRSPTMARRLMESSLLAWGAIADGLHKGMHAARCIAAAFGGVVDLRCYR